jgi:hypothetical protein
LRGNRKDNASCATDVDCLHLDTHLTLYRSHTPAATIQDILTELKEVKMFVQKRDILDKGILSASRYGSLQLKKAKDAVQFTW